uniref:Uncharacterized protein n=1 Tax=Strombidium inclinatum TaxID=197538 RepID=A0A7S3IM57_9SPIT|mmetsp:Transcript_27930/g.42211  ORF Transcript_27930/g.42211 Transcript_27930/m.42211 type:complete len:121 (+) Transcript_27930:955-1317(+)
MIEDGTMKDLPGNERQALTDADISLISQGAATHDMPEGYRFVYYSELNEDLLYSGVISKLEGEGTIPFVVNGYTTWEYHEDTHSRVLKVLENCGEHEMGEDDVVLIVKDSYFIYAGEEDG